MYCGVLLLKGTFHPLFGTTVGNTMLYLDHWWTEWLFYLAPPRSPAVIIHFLRALAPHSDPQTDVSQSAFLPL